MKRLILAAAVLVATALPAAAQNWGGVLVAGDEGITTAVEHDSNGMVFRGGVISRQGGSQYDPTVGFVLRHGAGPVTVDGGLDLERMHPDRRMDNPEEPVDIRARFSFGVRVAQRAAALVEYSRSFHNESSEGRWMLGVRFGI